MAYARRALDFTDEKADHLFVEIHKHIGAIHKNKFEVDSAMRHYEKALEYTADKDVLEQKDTRITENERFYIVDKETLNGAYFKLENDFLGGSNEWPESFFGNYFVRNTDPGDLYDELEKILTENQTLEPSLREKLSKLKESITDQDNNYILYAKLKNRPSKHSQQGLPEF